MGARPKRSPSIGQGAGPIRDHRTRRGRRARAPSRRVTPDGESSNADANPQALVARAAARAVERPSRVDECAGEHEGAAIERQRERERFTVKDVRQRAAAADSARAAVDGDGLDGGAEGGARAAEHEPAARATGRLLLPLPRLPLQTMGRRGRTLPESSAFRPASLSLRARPLSAAQTGPLRLRQRRRWRRGRRGRR